MTDEKPVVLELRGITKRFGTLIANDAIDLVMRKGEILALLGENGAGKTTLMNILFGHYVADEGAVLVGDEVGAMVPLTPGSPRAALDAGIGMVHQHFALAENLSVLDNITLGTEPLLRLTRSDAAARLKLQGLMERSGLRIDLDAPVAQLSVGERQRIEILKALYRDARILVLDEPTAVLTPQESDGLFQTLRSLAAQGLSVVFISHKLHEVVSGSDRVAVLRGGRKVAEIATRGSDKAQLAELMVGRVVSPSKREPLQPGAPVLILADVSVSGGTLRHRLGGIELTVREGEIVGIAGVSGNGQSALAGLLSGLVVPSSGTMSLGGAVLGEFDPQAFVAAGVGRIPEDRHHEGAVGTMTIAENIVLETVAKARFQRFGFLKFGAIRRRAEEAIAAYDIRCPGPDAVIRQLSGGNMQKVILARALDDEPQLILANQPTRGLDVGAVAEVHRRLLAARERGAAIVLITEDLDELFALSDRVAVMFRSRMSETMASETLDLKTLGLMMAGQNRGEAA